ncbi:hypothetical protein [Thermogymnomonas acidicola]|uniref:hypothetical protein n=1 Tax=Thermogymnomonas acidicola TaxID=399579 RepID=UPI0009463697|nr:hypothetical protein [Thermogymnomonas acidicola]
MAGRTGGIERYLAAGTASEEQVREEFSSIYGVDPSGVVVTHGATEGVFLVALALRLSGKETFTAPRPEYELMFKAPPAISGMREENGGGVTFASNPNNPPTGAFRQAFRGGNAVVDETFLMFHTDPGKVRYAGDVFRVTTLTKFFGADDVRVGFIVCPDTEMRRRIEGGLRGPCLGKHAFHVPGIRAQDPEGLRQHRLHCQAHGQEEPLLHGEPHWQAEVLQKNRTSIRPGHVRGLFQLH